MGCCRNKEGPGYKLEVPVEVIIHILSKALEHI